MEKNQIYILIVKVPKKTKTLNFNFYKNLVIKIGKINNNKNIINQ